MPKAKQCAYEAGNPSSLFFIENDITSIEEIEMQLQVSLYSLLKGNITEQLLDKTFVLNP